MRFLSSLCFLCVHLSVALCGADRSFIDVSFRELLGIPRVHQQVRFSEKDLERLKRLEDLYEKNKKQQFLETSDMRIPKVMHLIWLGPNSFPIESLDNVRTWVATHPDWTLKLWSDRERILPGIAYEAHDVRDFDFEFLKRQFEASDNWGERSDILRYEILFREGGVYFDHDANCLRSFEGLHRGYDFYACLETPHREISDYVVSTGIGIIGARAGHPVIRDAIAYIDKNWDALTTNFTESPSADMQKLPLFRTYLALTHAIDLSIDQGSDINIVFPSSYFYPTAGLTPIYSEHFYGGKWNTLNKDPESAEAIILNKIHTLSKENLKVMKLQVLMFVLLLLSFFIALAMIRNGGKRALLLALISLTISLEGTPKSHGDEFRILMGMQDAPESYLLLPEDRVDYDRLEKHWLSENTEHYQMIPKQIHFIWLGHRELPASTIKNMESWKKYHPEWQVNLWVDRPRDIGSIGVETQLIGALTQTPFDETIRKAENPGEASHLLRYKILHQRGGVYVDHDVKCFQPITALVEGIDFFCGLKPLGTIHFHGMMETSNHLIGSSVGNPLLKEVMELIPTRWEEGNRCFSGQDKSSLIYRNAYHAQIPFDEIVKRHVDRPDFGGKVYPANYFYKTPVSKPIYTLHQHAGTWHRRQIGKHEKQIYQRLESLITKSHLLLGCTFFLGALAIASIFYLSYRMRIQLRRIEWTKKKDNSYLH